MRIEAVTTCVGYSDFLSHSLMFNRNAFDHLVVVTTPDDYNTIKTCDFWGVHCVKTTVFSEGGPFNKAKAINVGLKHLSLSDWVIHIDADIALPPGARNMFRNSEPDPECIYGVDRLNCKSFDAWGEFLSSPTPQHELNVFVHPHPFPMATRIAKSEYGGYIPIGYFQAWNPSASGISHYPEGHTDAARSDMLFALQWKRKHRRLIPDIFAYHLESAPAPMGANWKGRTTPWFGPASRAKSQPAKPMTPHPDTVPDEEKPYNTP